MHVLVSTKHMYVHNVHIHAHAHVYAWCCTHFHTKPALAHTCRRWDCAGATEAASPLSHVSLVLYLHSEITLPPMLAVKAEAILWGGCLWRLDTVASLFPTELAHAARALRWVSISGQPWLEGHLKLLKQSWACLGWSHPWGGRGVWAAGVWLWFPLGGGSDWPKVTQLESTNPGLPTCSLPHQPQLQNQWPPLKTQTLIWPQDSPTPLREHRCLSPTHIHTLSGQVLAPKL